MRNELQETALIDRYLLGRLDEEETRAFEADMIVSHSLAEKVDAQRIAHRLILRFARACERSHLENIYRQLLNDSGFARQLKEIFA